ncbi:MAG: DNA polymerase III subunit alpha [Desulfatirhabdiaceae bacterium]
MIPLATRSHYSLMWGTASVQALCAAARRLGYPALALTDTDNLYGLWPFLAACRKEGLRPVIGAEITDPGSPDRCVCLVKTHAGYRNLCRLVTCRHMNPGFRLDRDLPGLSQGLMVLTRHPHLLTAWQDQGVDGVAAIPGRPKFSDRSLIRTASDRGIPVAAIPGCYFLEPDDVSIHRLLRAIDRNTTLFRLNPADSASPDAWLAGPDAYASRFEACPEAIETTHRLFERLTFTGPDFGVVMPPWSDPGGRTPAQSLRQAAYAGAHKRYGNELSETVVDRLEHELKTIETMGFSAYFLVVRDIVQTSPRTCGRGSGSASLVAFCLGITNVCPVRHNLYFERFLNPGRSDPPDIDVDFAWDERDAVITAVLERFTGHSAMVSSHVLFQPRMALRETARVFGLPESEISRVTRQLPWFWHTDSQNPDMLADMQAMPETRTLSFPDPWPRILNLAGRLIGTPRCLSVHPGGVIITPEPIDTYVPVQRTAKGVPVVQWEKDSVEDAGLVKIDLLGNRSLGVIRDALNALEKNGMKLDEPGWNPEDDLPTRATIEQGNTMGCFYIESPAMRQLQQKAGVGDFDHLVIHSSIIRPAANPYIQAYLARLHGADWNPIHPLLSDVLDETFGIMVYQEDVSRTAVALAGFSHAAADRLRKIMSRKDRQARLADFYGQFVSGARTRGVSDDQINAIWNMMMSFDGYSFCKPHSASYARVSFQAAYLKTHFPAEFMAAVIRNGGGYYSTFAYTSEARRMGLTILPPDVNCSQIHWTGCGKTLRVGLQSVKGLSESIQNKILSCRDRAFPSMDDFLERVCPNDSDVRVLVRCGALDSLAPHAPRAALMWKLAQWQQDRSKKPGKNPGLFAAEPIAAYRPIPNLPADSPEDRLRQEFETLGFLCDRHPMTLFSKTSRPDQMVTSIDLPNHIGRRVHICAWLITGKVVHTRQGHPMEFITFEDEAGMVETVFFPKVYDRFCHLLNEHQPYRLSGKVAEKWGAVTVTVDRVLPMCPGE